MDTQSEILKNKDQSWGYYDDLLFTLESPSPIRHVELSAPLYLNETPDHLEISVTDMLIFHAHQAVTLKSEIEQLTPFQELTTLGEVLLLENGNKTLRIKLACFLSSYTPSEANFQPLFAAADSIYELLKSYQFNVYDLSKQMHFPILSAHDRTWKLVFKTTNTQIPRSHGFQKRQDTFFSPNTIVGTEKAGIAERDTIFQEKSQAVPLSIIHPDKLLEPPNTLKLSESAYIHFKSPQNYCTHFSILPSRNLNDSFYESLITGIQKLKPFTSQTLRSQLIAYLRQNRSTYAIRIKIKKELNFIPDFELWLKDINDCTLRHIPSCELHALAQLLNRHIIIVNETGEMEYHLTRKKIHEPIFILLQNNGLSYDALKVRTHAEAYIQSAIMQQEAIQSLATPYQAI